MMRKMKQISEKKTFSKTLTSSELIELQLFECTSSTDFPSPVPGAGGKAVMNKNSNFFSIHFFREKYCEQMNNRWIDSLIFTKPNIWSKLTISVVSINILCVWSSSIRHQNSWTIELVKIIVNIGYAKWKRKRRAFEFGIDVVQVAREYSQVFFIFSSSKTYD